MITKTNLYNGSVELLFDDAKHRFTVDGKTILSVTAATSVIDKSRPLIYWAVGLSKNFLMENLKELIDDTKGARIASLIEEASKQHAIVKAKAADVGTQVHGWAENFIKTFCLGKVKSKKDYPEIPKDPQIANGITAFLKWVDEHDVRFVSSERKVYSKKHRYAGIMDAEAIIDKKLSPIDFKTSKGIYPEFRFQVAAYQGAVEEENGKPYPGDKWLVRFSKEDGEFEAHQFDCQEEDFKAFLAALALRRRLKELEVPYVKK